MIRGEIWWCDFGVPRGSEAGYRRPVLIIQDNNFNKTELNTVLVLPITTNLSLKDVSGNVFLPKEISGLSKDSVVVMPLLTHVDKQVLEEKCSKITNKSTIEEIEDGLLLILGINSSYPIFNYAY
ncbi:MAG: type II toxin-antitoxin system PemK/MazF family toxin [Chitinivibrionia bacterium]|nr:type II toxin-antitoxin system PemK/MazF family toxin [Chitinivibrionia bacterium]